MKIARRSLILLLVLATLVLVLRLFGIMWVAHWKTLTETEARKLIVKAQKNRRYEETFYSDSPPDIDFYRY